MIGGTTTLEDDPRFRILCAAIFPDNGLEETVSPTNNPES
jgi:hypothetical protein